MHNGGDSANVILSHFAYGVHMFNICETLKVRKISNTKTGGFCRSAPRTGLVRAETCVIARNVTAVRARDHKRNAKATRKTTLSALHTHSRITDYEMHATQDTQMAMRNVYRILFETPQTNKYFRTPPKLGGSNIV